MCDFVLKFRRKVNDEILNHIPFKYDANLDFFYISVKDAITLHKSNFEDKQLAWQSFKYHSSTDIEAKYWKGYYYYHCEKIPEIQKLNKEERIKMALDLFKETADKGN